MTERWDLYSINGAKFIIGLFIFGLGIFMFAVSYMITWQGMELEICNDMGSDDFTFDNKGTAFVFMIVRWYMFIGTAVALFGLVGLCESFTGILELIAEDAWHYIKLILF